MVAYDVLHAGGDIVGAWASPLHSSGRDWLLAGLAVVGSAAFLPVDDDIDRWFVRHHDSGVWSALKEVREGGHAFAGTTITPVAAGVYVIGLVTKNRGMRDGVWGCAASYASESVVRSQVMYRLIARERPDSGRGAHALVPSKEGDQYKFDFPGSNAWGKHSLPAGHVANVAACAGFLSGRFENPYITIPAHLAVAAVGIGRMVDRRHWTSDTVLGVLFGYAVGNQVAIRSLERRDRDEPSGSASAAPRSSLFLGSSDGGLVVGWKATF